MTMDPNVPPGSVPPPADVPPTPGAPLSYGGPTDIYNGPPPSKDESTMAMVSHLTAIFGWLNWVGPLIIYNTRKESPFIQDQSRQALNWALTVLIGFLAPIILFWCPPVAALVVLGVLITNLIFCIMAALKANKGVAARYPFSIKWFK